ncbi:hypothetical protein [Streptomyces sp. IBSBF 3010]|uniref:hypothetical protein n=1 Tax=Streptomyces sp. IBSBF 3010 TaxID=2903526 RepID=UPI002FDBB9CC
MTYTAEQKVKFIGMTMPATIISGPHPTHGADRWLIRKADGKVSLVKASELSPLLSRREAVAKVVYESQTARRWEFTSSYARTGWLRVADKVLAALEDAADAEKPGPLKAGDRIRILRSGLEFASVTAGDILTVTAVNGTRFNTNAPNERGIHAYWTFDLSGEGKGWERA